jgi:hypothetical protein
LSPRRESKVNSTTPYFLDGTALPLANFARDLGVTIDPQLKFDMHAANIAKECSKLSNFILRAFIIRSPDVYLNMFNSLVIPKMLYASSVWRPCVAKDTQRLEKIQRLFLKRVAFRCHLDPYIMKNKLPPIEERLNYADSSALRRVLKNEDMTKELFDITFSHTRAQRNMRPHVTADTKIISSLFVWRVCSALNYIPSVYYVT